MRKECGRSIVDAINKNRLSFIVSRSLSPCTGIIIAAELRYRADKSDADKLEGHVNMILSSIEIRLAGEISLSPSILQFAASKSSGMQPACLAAEIGLYRLTGKRHGESLSLPGGIVEKGVNIASA